MKTCETCEHIGTPSYKSPCAECIRDVFKQPDLIRRQDAIDAIEAEIRCTDREDDISGLTLAKSYISSLPSADRPKTDCTDFLMWLVDEVLDEENWELNAVANGEIICRKLKKLGLLESKDGYYRDISRPTEEEAIELLRETGWLDAHDREIGRPNGEWVQDGVYDEESNTWTCNKCGEVWMLNEGTPEENNMNFCPRCGVPMRERRKK